MLIVYFQANTFPLDSEVRSLEEFNDGFLFNQILRKYSWTALVSHSHVSSVPMLTRSPAEDLDPDYAVPDLERKGAPVNYRYSTLVSGNRNLELVYKRLVQYINAKCGELKSLVVRQGVDFSTLPDTPKLVKVASDSTLQPAQPSSALTIYTPAFTNATIQLLTLLLMAAIKGPNGAKYIDIIQDLDISTKDGIAKIIKQVGY